MGILNVTPDSFSDGGRHADPATALAAARAMRAAGADIVDVGAESTRPRAPPVDTATEAARLAAVLPGLAGLPWSIDSRRAAVMAAALAAGAALVNDVSALTHDPASLAVVAAHGAPVVLMHAQGTPETNAGRAALRRCAARRVRLAGGADRGVRRGGDSGHAHRRRSGIGFGKRLDHNLALLRGLPLLHGLGVPLLLGASRKALIGRIAGDVPPHARLPGSLALALHGAACGVQMVRVHDVPETVQALAVWRAAR